VPAVVLLEAVPAVVLLEAVTAVVPGAKPTMHSFAAAPLPLRPGLPPVR
jgi:hypothetical protein